MKVYVRLNVDEKIFDILDLPKLEKNKKHNISIVVDRTTAKFENKSRLVQSIETSLTETNGLVDIVSADNPKKKVSYSTQMACSICGFSILSLNQESSLIAPQEHVCLAMD